MTPELAKAYEDSCVPFIDGAISAETTKLRPWRVFLEVNSVCNLHCPTCTKGNQEGYEHLTGVMEPDLMKRILNKIANENPNAIVFLYGNSEPFLHPSLPECILQIRAQGLHPELSTNLNRLNRVEEVLEARPDMIIISLSGWTQEIYQRGHAGGNIERVKANMRTIAETNNRIPESKRVRIEVNYHVYNDNEHEIAPMREYARNLGLGFFTSMARAISMENAIQYCRSKDPDATPFDDPVLNAWLPPVTPTYVSVMERLKIPPTQAREMYKDYPESQVCPVGAGAMFSFVRHDGKIQLCACTADRRLTLGNYLDMTPDQMIEKRVDHSFCKQCKFYKNNFYFHIIDREKWEP